MYRSRKFDSALLLGILLCASSVVTLAESGFLVVHVKDVQERPIAGLQIGVKGDGGSAMTGDDGKARIQLAKQTKENDWVSLQILRSPPGKDFVMVSPWDYGAFVPSFANESKNVVEIVVVQRGDLVALKRGPVLKSLAEQINRANAPKTADKQAPHADPKASLDAVAKQYGLAPDDLDQAIRAWGAKTGDPYEAGLAALYEKRYGEAADDLQLSLRAREEDLKRTQTAVYASALYLGKTRYAEGDYKGASDAFQKAARLKPDEPELLEAWAQNSVAMGDYSHAESLLLQALAVLSKEPGNKLLKASVMDDLAGVRYRKADYAGAEALYQESLEIRESLDPGSLAVASSQNNLGVLLTSKGDYTEAESLLRRAITTREKRLGPDHPDVAASLNNLGNLLESKGDYTRAEPVLLRALQIDERVLGFDHPTVATMLDKLAHLLEEKGDYDAAEPLFRRALDIQENNLGPDHPDMARSLNGLASVLEARGDYAGAESLLHRALAIQEKALGPDHPDVAQSLVKIGRLLCSTKRCPEAQPLFTRALGIIEGAFGADSVRARELKKQIELAKG